MAPTPWGRPTHNLGGDELRRWRSPFVAKANSATRNPPSAARCRWARRSADTSGITDPDGLDNATFSYQWLAGDVDISGATGDSYTLTDSEEGKAIRVP